MPYEKLLKEPGLFCFDKDEFQGDTRAANNHLKESKIRELNLLQ